MKFDIEEFMADVCDVIGGLGVWPSFVRRMEEMGYTESQIDEGFEKIGKAVGRG